MLDLIGIEQKPAVRLLWKLISIVTIFQKNVPELIFHRMSGLVHCCQEEASLRLTLKAIWLHVVSTLGLRNQKKGPRALYQIDEFELLWWKYGFVSWSFLLDLLLAFPWLWFIVIWCYDLLVIMSYISILVAYEEKNMVNSFVWMLYYFVRHKWYMLLTDVLCKFSLCFMCRRKRSCFFTVRSWLSISWFLKNSAK